LDENSAEKEFAMLESEIVNGGKRWGILS